MISCGNTSLLYSVHLSNIYLEYFPLTSGLRLFEFVHKQPPNMDLIGEKVLHIIVLYYVKMS